MMGKKSLDKNEKTEKVAKLLRHLQADTYLLYIKTQNFHWNVKDPRFYSLHKLFESQYEELADAVDEIAERLRQLEYRSLGSMKEFLAHTSLKENSNQISGDEMILELTQDHRSISKTLSTFIKKTTELGDDGTADLFIRRIQVHDKAAWFLSSHL